MKAKTSEYECSKLPRLVKIIGERGNYVLYILKAGSRKLGAQLVKLDRNNAHLLE
jgi:hypothetical protein